MKKLLSILLAFAMFAGMLPEAVISVRADDNVWTYGTTRVVDESYNNSYKLIKGDSIGQFLLDIGCDRDKIYTNNFNKIRPQTDSLGVTMGQKKLKYADGTETGRILIPVAIRGANYEKEWASNATLGSENENEGEAKGFSTAAQTVFKEIQGYIQNHGLQEAVENGKVNFWIAGYSRAGATTNLTARRLVDAYAPNRDGNRVYAYCVEAPQGGWKAAEKSGSDYSCIHSIINKTDLVPRTAPTSMKFQRYGVDHYIPGTDAGTPSGVSDNQDYAVGSSEKERSRYQKIAGRVLLKLPCRQKETVTASPERKRSSLRSCSVVSVCRRKNLGYN